MRITELTPAPLQSCFECYRSTQMAFKLAQYKCQDFRQNLNQLSLKIMFSFKIPNPIEAQLKLQ